jgi:hypothetical protein
VFLLLGGIVLLTAGALIGSVDGGTGLGGLAAIIGLITLVVGAAELICAWGFWSLRPWAWTLGIVLAVVSVALLVVQALLSGNIVGSLVNVNSLVTIVISAVIVWYLMQPQIKAAFGRS